MSALHLDKKVFGVEVNFNQYTFDKNCYEIVSDLSNRERDIKSTKRLLLGRHFSLVKEILHSIFRIDNSIFSFSSRVFLTVLFVYVSDFI